MIQIKNAAELEKMRKACAISAAALKAGGEAIEPGITTAEIDKIIYDFIVRHGARPNFLHLYGFPATACISVNDTVIHGIPSRQQQIRPGDIVSIDTGCKIDGFNGDNACTYACGKIDLEAQRLLDVTKEGLHRGIGMARGGNRVGDIGHAVQSYVEENGFSVVRSFVGHGVGMELHEDPEVPNFGTAGRGPRLMPGMTIAIEPMINAGTYLVKEMSDGWTVKEADAEAATMTIVKDDVEVSLTLGGDSGKGGGTTARAGAAPSGERRSALLSSLSLSSRRKQRQAAAAAEQAKAEAAAAEREAEREAQAEQEKQQREAERAEQRQQLLAIQEELRRVREARAAEAEKPAESAEADE